MGDGAWYDLKADELAQLLEEAAARTPNAPACEGGEHSSADPPQPEAERGTFARRSSSTSAAQAGAVRSPTGALAQTSAPPPCSTPGTTTGPLLFRTECDALPDSPGELLSVIQCPKSVGHALAAMAKLGALYGRDPIDDNSRPSPVDFHPMVIAAGIGSGRQAISNFVIHAVPLRRALGRHYAASTPDVALLCDLLTLAYYKAVQAERVATVYLTAALERPALIDHLAKLETIKGLAVAQVARLLDALRVATGRRLVVGPEGPPAQVLPFPATELQNVKRPRRKSAE